MIGNGQGELLFSKKAIQMIQMAKMLERIVYGQLSAY